MNENEYTLTSKLGRFTFPNNVRFSHAKMVRDCITAQYFSPDQKRIIIAEEADAYTYMANHPTAEFSTIDFGVSFEQPVRSPKSNRRLSDVK